jgi:hypothetical protein
MITEVISFKNFNGEDDSRVLNFHITEATLMENMSIRDKIAALADVLGGPERQLVTQEIQDIVNLVKWFMSVSYGIKSADGTYFDQDDPAGSGEVWRKFKNSPAYNAFLMSLFREPEKAVAFVVNVLPAELSQAASEAAKDNPQMQAMLKEAQKANRLAPGTRIVDGVPQVPDAPVAPPLSVVPQPVDESAPDFEAMLASADATGDPYAGKSPITQHQYDHMKKSLAARPDQFEQFMSTRYVADGAPTE